MPDPVTPPSGEGRTTNRGVVAELLNFAASLGQHVQHLVALASLESKEAAGVYIRALIALGAALILLVFGYLLSLIFVAFLLAQVFGIAWLWICLGLAVAHLLGVLACGLYIRARIKSPVFTATTAEMQRDLEALKNFKA